MLRFNNFLTIVKAIMNSISIHLMLRFNTSLTLLVIALNKISIHLMLRFNFCYYFLCFFISIISIHLMLRFNLYGFKRSESSKRFQYILCYGSTTRNRKTRKEKNHFNTSYVTVQLFLKSSLT